MESCWWGRCTIQHRANGWSRNNGDWIKKSKYIVLMVVVVDRDHWRSIAIYSRLAVFGAMDIHLWLQLHESVVVVGVTVGLFCCWLVDGIDVPIFNQVLTIFGP